MAGKSQRRGIIDHGAEQQDRQKRRDVPAIEDQARDEQDDQIGTFLAPAEGQTTGQDDQEQRSEAKRNKIQKRYPRMRAKARWIVSRAEVERNMVATAIPVSQDAAGPCSAGNKASASEQFVISSPTDHEDTGTAARLPITSA
jgi:hypothetical protein